MNSLLSPPSSGVRHFGAYGEQLQSSDAGTL